MARALPIVIFVFAVLFFLVTERANYFSNTSPHAPKVIHFWAAATPAQTLDQLKAEFEDQFPQYQIEIQTVAWQSLQEKTLWAVAANSNVPDLIVGSSEWTGGLANNGALDPLDNYLDEDFFSRFFPAALGTYQFPEIDRERPGWRGRIRQYGIPLDLDMMLIFYRSDMIDPVLKALNLKEFPSTWDDFARLGHAVHEKYRSVPGSPQLLYLDPEDPVPLRMAFLPSSGGMLFNADFSTATYNSSESSAAFQYFGTLLHNGTALSWNRNTLGDPFDLVKSGRVLGNIAGPWFGKVLEHRTPEQAGKWRVALFPKRGASNPSCGLGGSCLAMPYNARNKEGAVELARYMSTDRFALAYFRRVGSPPPQKSAWNDPVFDEPSAYFGGQRLYQVVRRSIEDSIPLQLLPSAEVMKSHFPWAMQEFAKGKSDPEQILDKAVKLSNQVLTAE